jgi:integrase/recombinase XerD
VNSGKVGASNKVIESALFEKPSARSRFLAAPCLKEREQYLFHLMRRGYGLHYLRVVSFFMLRIIQFLRLTTLRMVELEEIDRAALAWAAYRGPDRRGTASGTTVRFSRVAKKWLRFHGQLAEPTAPVHPYEREITNFTESLRSIGAVSSATIDAYRWRVKLVLASLDTNGKALSSVTLNDIDKFFEAKLAQGWRLPTLASHCQALRAFFLHAEGQGWCSPGLVKGIRSPILPKDDSVSRGPTWGDVRRLLRHESKLTTTSGLRTHAMLLLCSIYALRSGEVSGLRLVDIDWREETFSVKRSKRGGYQRYPLQYEVGEAILRYLRVRPRCSCRNVFVTLAQPYRRVSSGGMHSTVRRRFKALGIQSKNRGPHALRHACATHLLKAGTPLKDIADFLGHRDTKMVGVYAKFDIRSLRKVAAFSLKGM